MWKEDNNKRQLRESNREDKKPISMCVSVCVFRRKKRKKKKTCTAQELFFFCCCCYFPEVSSTKVFLLNLVDVGCFFFSLLFFPSSQVRRKAITERPRSVSVLLLFSRMYVLVCVFQQESEQTKEKYVKREKRKSVRHEGRIERLWVQLTYGFEARTQHQLSSSRLRIRTHVHATTNTPRLTNKLLA